MFSFEYPWKTSVSIDIIIILIGVFQILVVSTQFPQTHGPCETMALYKSCSVCMKVLGALTRVGQHTHTHTHTLISSHTLVQTGVFLCVRGRDQVRSVDEMNISGSSYTTLTDTLI